MDHRRPRPTFAEQLRDVRATPLRLEGQMTAQAAQDAVRRGALLAWEPCGCGGGDRCHPEWVTDEDRARLDGPPQLRGRRGTPTWLALWSGPALEVVLAHGDVVWGNALA